MTTYRQVIHAEDGGLLLPQVRWCNSFSSKLRGFTFKRRLSHDDGLVLVEKADSRVSTAVTMLFVFFDLGIIWINEAGTIVDMAIGKPWRLSYLPKAPACYVLEVHPCLLQQVKIGDRIQFLEPRHQ